MFRKLYTPIVDVIPGLFLNNGEFSIDAAEVTEYMETLLPEQFKSGLECRVKGTFACANEDLIGLGLEERVERINKSVSSIVAIPALLQAIKGMVSVGPKKAMAYAQEKLGKGRE